MNLPERMPHPKVAKVAKKLAELEDLRHGDHLLYGRSGSIFDWIVSVKTWSKAVHIEIYAGDGMSMASRNKLGVNLYGFRREQLICVLRPKLLGASTIFERGFRWFSEIARGQKYDWMGLLCFTLAVRQGSPDRMFCSEFANNFDRVCGLGAFASDWPGDMTAPGNFLMSPAFDKIWSAD